MARRAHIPGSRPVHPPGATLAGRAEPTLRLQVAVVLESAGLPAGHPLSAKVHAVDTAWPTQRPNLTLSDLEALNAPPEAAVEGVRAFARGYDLEVVEASAVRQDVILEGTAAALDRAFQVTQRIFEHEGGTYRAHEEPISLPEPLRGAVVGVLGLDTLSRARAHAQPEAAPLPAPLPPAWIARHYRFPDAPDLHHVRIALLEFGGGVSLDDVRGYLKDAGIPQGDLRILEVSDGGGRSLGNRPVPADKARAIMADWRRGRSLTEIFQAHPEAGAFYESLEVTMDAEIATALAPGAPTDLYFASGGADGWRRAICAASGLPYAGSLPLAHRHEEDRLPAVLSISWGFQERQLQPMKLRILHLALELAARRGITVVSSSGDRGSRMGGGAGDPLGVEFPASSPAVLGCGGTALDHREGTTVREVVWHQTLLGAEMASGGGMSGYFPRPPFQRGIAVPDPSGTWIAGKDEAFQGRWAPDVSALASFSPGVKLLMAGEPFAGGGTSAATPIWAALVARLAAGLGRPLGSVAPALYRLSRSGVLRPVEEGTNDLLPRGSGSPQYQAGTGWDPCTGLGVPDGQALLEALQGDPPHHR